MSESIVIFVDGKYKDVLLDTLKMNHGKTKDTEFAFLGIARWANIIVVCVVCG